MIVQVQLTDLDIFALVYSFGELDGPQSQSSCTYTHDPGLTKLLQGFLHIGFSFEDSPVGGDTAAGQHTGNVVRDAVRDLHSIVNARNRDMSGIT